MRVEGEGESGGVVSAAGAERAVGRRRKRVKRAVMFFMASSRRSRFGPTCSPARGPQLVVSCLRCKFYGRCRCFVDSAWMLEQSVRCLRESVCPLFIP